MSENGNGASNGPNNGKRRVALVGHCGPDSYALSSAVQGFLPGADVLRINDASELERNLPELDLLLINRVIDGRFQSDKGVALIRELRERGEKTAMLLISDRPEAQAEAQEAGGQPGFGKSEMRDDKARDRILSAMSG